MGPVSAGCSSLRSPDHIWRLPLALFRPDYSDLLAAVDWARGHPDEASAIAAAASRLVNKQLRRQDALCYTHRRVRQRLACRPPRAAHRVWCNPGCRTPLHALQCCSCAALAECLHAPLALQPTHHRDASHAFASSLLACLDGLLAAAPSHPAGCCWSMRLCTVAIHRQKGWRRLAALEQWAERQESRAATAGAAEAVAP